MPYDITVQSNGPYLLISVRGAITQENELHLDHRIWEFCAEHQLSRVLVDFRAASGELSAGDVFRLASTLHARRETDLERSAYLDIEERDFMNSLYETTATNRGAAVRRFTDADEAHQWLTACLD